MLSVWVQANPRFWCSVPEAILALTDFSTVKYLFAFVQVSFSYMAISGRLVTIPDASTMSNIAATSSSPLNNDVGAFGSGERGISAKMTDYKSFSIWPDKRALSFLLSKTLPAYTLREIHERYHHQLRLRMNSRIKVSRSILYLFLPGCVTNPFEVAIWHSDLVRLASDSITISAMAAQVPGRCCRWTCLALWTLTQTTILNMHSC